MKYRDGEVYEGQYAGVKIRFSLQGFSQKTVERFNEFLAKEALKHEQRGIGLLRKNIL